MTLEVLCGRSLRIFTIDIRIRKVGNPWETYCRTCSALDVQVPATSSASPTTQPGAEVSTEAAVATISNQGLGRALSFFAGHTGHTVMRVKMYVSGSSSLSLCRPLRPARQARHRPERPQRPARSPMMGCQCQRWQRRTAFRLHAVRSFGVVAGQPWHSRGLCARMLCKQRRRRTPRWRRP